MAYIHPKDEECVRLLQCWVIPPAGDEPPTTFERGDNVQLMENLGDRLFRGGRFKFLRLVQWNESTLDYRDVLREWPE